MLETISQFWGQYGGLLLEGTRDTLSMVLISTLFAYVIGLPLGVVLWVTDKDGLHPNKGVNTVLGFIVNFFRSIPFIILLTWVITLSRANMGTAINVPGAIVPLIMGTVPFFSRQVEGALDEIDHGLIEAVLSMGSSPLEIIFRVYLRESVSAIARGTTITAISLVGLTAMAGAVGSGGLGNFAIQYGHDRNMTDVTWVTVIVVFIIVSIIQLVGNLVVKKNKH